MTNEPERTGDRGLLRSVPSPLEETPQPRARKAPSASAAKARKRAAAEPTYEQIARRAYEIYLARGGAGGHHREDWLLAEAELRRGSRTTEAAR